MFRTRRILVSLTCVALLCGAVSAQPLKQPAAPFKVGVANRNFAVDRPYNWRGAKTHALSAIVWYPAVDSADEAPQWIGSSQKPLFAAGRAAPDAAVVSAPARLPLIVLSHGTGGSALQMAWLGTALAAHGYLAVAVNHPGNNSYEGYTPQGFSTWWERARDLSTVIDAMLADSGFGGHIDSKRIGAAGFSLGGYTMIAVAGGITDPAAFTAFCKSAKADGICKSPAEFPTLLEDFEKLSNSDPEFQESLRHATASYRDRRVRAVFAIAPALGPAFPARDLRIISIPVEIVAGTADANVPIASSAKYFETNIPGAKLKTLPGVGHYVFLDTCTDQGRASLGILCDDGAGVDRNAIHVNTAGYALDFFGRTLH
jgi:predicted dienelactone hydrolase